MQVLFIYLFIVIQIPQLFQMFHPFVAELSEERFFIFPATLTLTVLDSKFLFVIPIQRTMKTTNKANETGG